MSLEINPNSEFYHKVLELQGELKAPVGVVEKVARILCSGTGYDPDDMLTDDIRDDGHFFAGGTAWAFHVKKAQEIVNVVAEAIRTANKV